MLDKKGNILGRINIVDFLIVASLIFAGVFSFTQIRTNRRESAEVKGFTMKFFAEEVHDFVASGIFIGDTFLDEAHNIDIGKITEINLGRGFKHAESENGELIKSPMEGHTSLEITVMGDGVIRDNGVIISGRTYEIGSITTMRMGKGKVHGIIAAIE